METRKNSFFQTYAGDGGFSLIEALVGAALISVTALGLGSAFNSLRQSRQKSQLVSMAVQTEAALVNAVQDPSSYASIAQALQSKGTPPTNFQIPVTVDAATGKSFSLRPGQQIYLTEAFKPCQGFSDKNCALLVALSPWGRNLPSAGQYSFGYSIQANPSLSNMSALGSQDSRFSSPSDFILTVPNLMTSGKIAQCDANAIGMLGVDSVGQALCLYYPDGKETCKQDELPKGFEVAPDSSDPHRYYLSFQCVPMRKISCGQPNFSFESFSPAALDPLASRTSLYSPVGKCVYIGKPSLTPITVNGANGIAISQACPADYAPATPTCVVRTVVPVNATCSDGHVLVAQTVGITGQLTITGNTVTCQALLPQQQCCANDPTKCSTVSVSLTANYYCALDSKHADEVIY